MSVVCRLIQKIDRHNGFGHNYNFCTVFHGLGNIFIHTFQRYGKNPRPFFARIYIGLYCRKCYGVVFCFGYRGLVLRDKRGGHIDNSENSVKSKYRRCRYTCKGTDSFKYYSFCYQYIYGHYQKRYEVRAEKRCTLNERKESDLPQ